MEPLGIMPELQSKQTTVISLDLLLYLKKLFFFRLELELTEILRESNFRFLVAGKRFASARALASLGFARLSQIDFTLLTFYKLKKNKKLITTRHVYCKSGNFCLTIFVQHIYPINMRAIYFKLHWSQRLQE